MSVQPFHLPGCVTPCELVREQAATQLSPF